MKGILRSKCLFKSKRNSSTLGPSIVTESFTSDGAEREAWFLGGHKRTITGHLDCCTGKGRICLEITDRWDYDEQDKLPPLRDFGGFCKTLSTKALGAILDFGELDWPAPVPVTGKTCIDFGP